MSNTYFLVRHGQSVYNIKQYHQGWKKRVHLSKEGKVQARLAGQRLIAFKPQIIISSTLLRAVQTARVIGSYINIPVIYSNKIIDYRRSARLEGLHFSRYIQDPNYLKWVEESSNNPTFALDDGESLAAFWNRIRLFIKGLEQTHSKQRIVIITHNDVIREIIQYLTGINVARGSVENSQIYQIEKKNEKFSLTNVF